MPLAGEVGILACEVVFAGDNFFACTDGAAAAVDTGFDLSAPLVTTGTNPPHGLVTAGNHIGRSECSVLRWVPLAGNVWIEAGEVVIAGKDVAVGADGTACTVDTGFDLSAPFVAVGAKPPHEPVAAGKDVEGVRAPFFVGCHWRARSGYLVARSVSPGMARRPVQ